jgi:hypothetical protein
MGVPVILIKGESTGNPVYKCVKHNKQEDKTKPGESLKVGFYQKVPEVSESIKIKVF